MEIFQKNKKIFIAIGVVIVVVLLYRIFFSGASKEIPDSSFGSSGLVSELSVSPADEIIGRELLTMLAQLRSIRIDDSIFGEQTFKELDDSSEPLEPQPLGKALGRKNPFSVFSSGASASSTDNKAGGAVVR